MTEKALAFSLPTKSEWEIIEHQSAALFKSGLLPSHIRTQQQALAIVLKGRELDVPPWTALTKIHVIQGVPTVAPELMLALVRRSGELEDFKIVENTSELCTIHAKRQGESAHAESFTFAEASQLKTKEDNSVIPLTQKYNWRQQPAVMLRWRCISRWARTYFGDIVSGLYTPEEIDPDVRIDEASESVRIPANSRGDVVPGEIVDGEAVADNGRPAGAATLYGNPDFEGLGDDEPQQSPPADTELPDDDKRMSELEGRDLYLIGRNGPGAVGIHKTHWANRMKAYWPDAGGDYRLVGDITVGEFIDMMREPSTEAAEDAA